MYWQYDIDMTVTAQVKSGPRFPCELRPTVTASTGCWLQAKRSSSSQPALVVSLGPVNEVGRD